MGDGPDKPEERRYWRHFSGRVWTILSALATFTVLVLIGMLMYVYTRPYWQRIQEYLQP